MNTKEEILEELKEAKLLNTFRVSYKSDAIPNDYFENFPVRMMNKISELEQEKLQRKNKIITIIQKISVAASVLLLIGLSIYVLRYQENSNIVQASTEISMMDDVTLYGISEADIIEIAVMKNEINMSDSIVNMYEDFDESDILELYN